MRIKQTHTTSNERSGVPVAPQTVRLHESGFEPYTPQKGYLHAFSPRLTRLFLSCKRHPLCICFPYVIRISCSNSFVSFFCLHLFLFFHCCLCVPFLRRTPHCTCSVRPADWCWICFWSWCCHLHDRSISTQPCGQSPNQLENIGQYALWPMFSWASGYDSDL